MRVLVALLLVGVVGCGGDSSPPGGGAVPTPEGSQEKTDKPPAQTTDADPAVDAQEEPPAVKALKVQLHYDEGGSVISANYLYSKPTDDDLVHLAGLTKLKNLNLISFTGTQITDAGLVHLKGLTGLHELHELQLTSTKITDAGLLHLKGMTKLQTLGLSLHSI